MRRWQALENQKRDIEEKKTTKRTPKAIIKKEAVQTPIVTKAATSLMPKTLIKRST